MRYTFNPFTTEFDAYDNESPFITYGDDGIRYIRFQSPDDNSVWDAYIDSTGAWVTVSISNNSGSPIGLLLALTYA